MHRLQSSTIQTQWIIISVKKIGHDDYLSLTDIAKFKNAEFPADVIKNWLRNKNTLEFLSIRERLYNPLFKLVEFDHVRNQAWYNAFVMSPQKWVEQTHAIWLITKSWRYGWWTFAHKDIAVEFASRISVEFRLYLVKDFQRLKESEQKQSSTKRNISRSISKINYKIHTDAIRDYLIPKELDMKDILKTYASEADLLNKVLFGKTAKERSNRHPNHYWNIRDHASIEQLIVLSNMESINALLIEKWIPQHDRIKELSQTAISQMKSLTTSASLPSLHFDK